MKALFIAAVLLLAEPVQAQKATTCSFNGRQESCTVTRSGNIIKVQFHSDGKVVRYSFYGCVPIAADTAERCQVRIVEDNGRITGGVAERGNRGASIISDHGNRTLILN
jgi:hypothetical protein